MDVFLIQSLFSANLKYFFSLWFKNHFYNQITTKKGSISNETKKETNNNKMDWQIEM